MPVSLSFMIACDGLTPDGAPVPMNGTIIVVGVAVRFTGSCGAYDPAGPPAFGSELAVESACALSLVEYWIEQPVPVTVPLMSNWTPVWAVASTQSVPAELPLK